MYMFSLFALLSCSPKMTTCPEGTVKISGGEYRIGVEEPFHKWHEPAKTVALESYCIDIYEYPNQKGQIPKSNVSWEEARDLCSAAGKRLCTGYEWERACRGTETWRYSYGPHLDRTVCNTPINGSGPGTNPPPIEPSGTYENCKSPEGVYDLNGSMSEWVSDSWSEFPEPFHRNAVVDPKEWRALRGGTMWSNTFYGMDCTSRHGHRKSDWRNMDDGFRCCADPN